MAIDSSRPRASQGYDFSSHSQMNTSKSDNYVVSRSAQVDVVFPTWQNTLTTFRPCPIKQADGSVTPYRTSSENSRFGDWLRSYLCFRGGAQGFVSFLCHDPSTGEEFDPHDSPPFVLYYAIKSAFDAGQAHPTWGPWLNGRNGKAAALSRPGMTLYQQGYLVEHKNKILRLPNPKGLNPPDRIQMLALSYNRTAVGDKYINALNQLKPNSNAPEGDWENLMEHGDPIAFESGRFLRLCEANGQLRQFMSAEASRNDDSDKGYDFVITREACVLNASLPPELAHAILGKTVPWESVFYFPTAEEQALYLARVFSGDAIEYAFAQKPEWLTSDVLNITRSRTSMGGGNGAAYNMPQQSNQQGGYQQGYQQQGGYQQSQNSGYAPQNYVQQSAPQNGGYVSAPANTQQAAPQHEQAQQQSPAPQQHQQQSVNPAMGWGNVPFGNQQGGQQPPMQQYGTTADTAVRPGANMPAYGNQQPINPIQVAPQQAAPQQQPLQYGVNMPNTNAGQVPPQVRADALAAAQAFLPGNH